MEKILQSGEETNIDVLSDDILINIIGRLDNVKHSAKTSVVCQRWRNLWVFSPNLNFGKDMDDHNLVIQALKAYKGSTVESLRIALHRKEVGFKFNESLCSIRECVKFANKKRVQTLELDLSDQMGQLVFPFNIPLVSDRLKSVSLNSMHLTDEDFGRCLLLVNLETLSLRGIEGLERVQVTTPNLKQLMLVNCVSIETIDLISAPNLQYFKHCNTKFTSLKKYLDQNIELSLNSVPKLSSLCLLGGRLCANKSLIKLNNIGVEKLVLDMDYMLQDADHFPQLYKLKQLELRFVNSHPGGANCKHNLIFTVINACPSLEKLTLNYEILRGPNRDGVVKFKNTFKHKCLTVVEFIGWCGFESEIQLANHLIDTCTNLRELAFDSNIQNDEDRQWRHRYMKDTEKPGVKAATLSAKQLATKFGITYRIKAVAVGNFEKDSFISKPQNYSEWETLGSAFLRLW